MRVCSEDGCEKPHYCKGMCNSHYDKARYYADREAQNARCQAYKDANREVLRAKDRAKYAQDPESERARCKEYYATHREDVLARGRIRSSLLPPEYARAKKARRRQRLSVNMSPQDRKDSVEWRKVIRDLPCYYCGDDSEPKHDEHQTPLSRGGTDHWTNIVRSCQTCNLTKGTKTADEYIASRKEIESNDST